VTSTYEFRVAERFAHLFAGDEGQRLGSSVRKVQLRADDPRLPRVGELQHQLTARNEAFFFGWDIRRHYTSKELKSASLFLIHVSATFEPAGEECGTMYDESTACRQCGSGATLLPPLVLDTKRIPKGKNIAVTIADEVVASKSLVDLFRNERVTGVEFSAVRSGKRALAESSEWFLMQTQSHSAVIHPSTRIGNGPFDDDPLGKGRCPLGHLAGLNLLSDVSIAATSLGADDVASTSQCVGVRRGLLRPRRLMLASPKVWALITDRGLRGVQWEIAHLV
jgi:hypothetical protein